MAFPTATAPTVTAFATSVTTMAVTMPASVASGDLLIALVEVRNAGTWTKPTGWSDISTLAQAGGGSVGKLNGFYKIADGTEGGTTVTWTAGTATTADWQVTKVTGWHGTTPPEAATSSGDSTTQPDPPSLTPSWGAADNLWIEVAGNSATAALTTGASTNYSGYQLNTASSGGGQVSIASANRQLNASSENPGTFTNGGSIRFWAAATIAVRPAAASNTTTNQTQTGKARIQEAVNQTQTGKARITATTTKTQTGKARIQEKVNKTITGLARITAKTLQTVLGKARITATTNKTQTGKARIQGSASQTQLGKARIQISNPLFAQYSNSFSGGLTDFSQHGTWDTTGGTANPVTNTGPNWADSVLLTTANYQDVDIVVRVKKGTANDQVIFRSGITAGSGYGIQLRSDLVGKSFRLENWGFSSLVQVDSGITWVTGSWYVIRIRAVGTRILAKVWPDGTPEPTAWNIDYTGSEFSTGGVGFSTEDNLDASFDDLLISAPSLIRGLARITAATAQTILGKARITATTAKTQLGKARIQESATKTILGLANISGAVSKTITGLARITETATKTISGKARIQEIVNKTVLGKARIQESVSKTQTGKARITTSTTKTITGLSRIREIVLKTITGKARIQESTNRTVLGKARVTVATSQTITGVANIANIFTTKNQTITGKARIIKPIWYEKNNPAWESETAANWATLKALGWQSETEPNWSTKNTSNWQEKSITI